MEQTKPIFTAETYSTGVIRKHWTNYFAASGTTVYLKYMLQDENTHAAYIEVGKELAGDEPAQGIRKFKPDAQGTKEAVAYFQELTDQQNQQDNPEPPNGGGGGGGGDFPSGGGDGDGHAKVSVEDILKEIKKRMQKGEPVNDKNFDELEKHVTEPTQKGDGAEPRPINTGGDFPSGGGDGGEDEGPDSGGGDFPTGQPVNPAPINPNTLIEALEDYMGITRGQLTEVIPTKVKLMQRLQLLNNEDLSGIGARIGMTGSTGSQIVQEIVNESRNIYNG